MFQLKTGQYANGAQLNTIFQDIFYSAFEQIGQCLQLNIQFALTDYGLVLWDCSFYNQWGYPNQIELHIHMKVLRCIGVVFTSSFSESSPSTIW